MSFPLFFHLHIPSLIDLCTKAASSMLIRGGAAVMCQKVPYPLYLFMLLVWIRLHMPITYHSPVRWYFNVLSHTQTTHGRDHKGNVFTLISLLDHIDINKSGFTAVRFMLGRLSWRACSEPFLSLAVECIHRLAERMADYNFKDRVYVFSGGLYGMPLKKLRDTFILHGAQLDALSDRERLHIAAANGMIDIISERVSSLSYDDIMSCSYSSNYLPDFNYSLFELACRSGDVDTTLMLANRVNYRDAIEVDELHNHPREMLEAISVMAYADQWKAVCDSLHLDFTGISSGFSNCTSLYDVKCLLGYNADDTHLVREIARLGYTEIVEELIEKMGYTMPSDVFLYMFLDRYPYFDIVSKCLRYGGDVNARDNEGNPVIFYTPEYCRYFIEMGADPMLRSNKQRTMLHAMALKKLIDSNDLVSFLVHDCGVDVNARDDDGMTALHVTCNQGGELVDALIQHGAEISLFDNHNFRPLHYARERQLSPFIINKLKYKEHLK